MASSSSGQEPDLNGSAGSARMEKCAVEASFWIGGFGLAALKGFAYLATGSVLVRASMFDSIGDVFSSAIMWITQWKMNDSSDAHQYPAGKWRFAPLGVLFFCAFMFATMSSIALDSAQALFAPLDELADDDLGEGPTAAALRRLFAEKPRLRWAYAGRVEALISEYGAVDPIAEEAASADFLPQVLLGLCVAMKLCLWIFCRSVGGSSDIVKALGDDHRNDTMTNLLVTCSSIMLQRLEGSPYDTPMMKKLDPALSLLMSLYIVYGWVTNSLEQVTVLSDKRAGDEVDLEAVKATAAKVLKDKPLNLSAVDAYYVGEGYRVRLEICATDDKGEYPHVAAALEGVEAAVLSEMDGVKHVDVSLRLHHDHRQNSMFAWVQEYKKAPWRSS